jgi:hypothetical protein
MATSAAVEELVEAIRARAVSPGGFDDFESQSKRAHHCSHPVRLYGRHDIVDGDSGEIVSEDDRERLFLKACGNRRATRCLACSDVYRNDARHLVMAGLVGGKGVPESVVSHPMLFVTLTAPSFGAVHSRAKSGAGPCRPFSPSKRCRHGKPLSCFVHHDIDDDLLGQPMCVECYRYCEHVVWHGLMSELWRRTTIYVFRSLARALTTTPAELRKNVRLSYLKVVEYQTRGAVHLHVVARADGIGDGIVPQPSEVTAQVLA